MDTIKNFDQLTQHLKSTNVKKRIAVACPHDSHTIEAVEKAIDNGIATFILFGNEEIIRKQGAGVANRKEVTIINETDNDKAAALAVMAVRNGEADILMKGSINTDNILRAILNKEQGILPKGNVISHVTVMQIPTREKLIFMSDVAVIPYPTFEQKKQIVKYLTFCCGKFGIAEPKIALLHFTEKVNPKFPNSTDYVQLKELAQQNEFGKCVLDGPIDLRTAFDKEACLIKGIASPLDGDADGLLFPNIESGNIFYKAMTYFCNAEIAGVLMGAQCPVVVSSRGDSVESKYYSIAISCLIS